MIQNFRLRTDKILTRNAVSELTLNKNKDSLERLNKDFKLAPGEIISISYL